MENQINEILNRGVANIIPDKASLNKRLQSDEKLNIYFGIDPTATSIHIGNAVPLRKLQQFVRLGHHVTFLIGDFTALIGDTSDKDSERPTLTLEQIQENFKTYQKQAEKIIDFEQVTLKYNSEWLSKLNFTEIVKLCQHFSAGDFTSRELIKKRLNDGKRVGLHELLYPVMQGYDSYFLDTDLQIGGTDQTFNMQAGRILQKDLRNKESFVLSTPFLMGTDGRKMSKSWGNAIWLTDTPKDIYGKVMSLKDELIEEYFILATDLPLEEILPIKDPLKAKKKLAHTIVSNLHDPNLADLAQKEFESIFQNKGVPTQIPTYSISLPTTLREIAQNNHLVSSGTQFKQLVNSQAVELDNQIVSDPNLVIEPPKTESILRIGKLRYIKITS